MSRPNAQRPTSIVRLLAFLLALLPCGALVAQGDRLAEAVRPMEQGVPQVSAQRLEALRTQKLSTVDRQAVTAKLGEALLAAGENEKALAVLAEEPVRDLPETAFFRAQALAALGRWEEALPFYTQAAADGRVRFRNEARFGQAEALRALGRVDEALAALRLLEREERWFVPARLRMVELLLQKRDLGQARRLIQAMAPEAMTDKRARRYLRGRVEAQRNREQAIEMFESILRNQPETPHAVLIATLFANAEAHLQAGTPARGDDFLEDYIERRPADAKLPELFAKLDQLYAAQDQPSREDLQRWSEQPAQPRRALAQWYHARSLLRAGRTESARESFERMRAMPPAWPALAEGFLEYAEFEMREGRASEAVAILEEARRLRPRGPIASRIEMTLGRARYVADNFLEAAQVFRQLAAQSQPPVATDALYNATIAWLSAEEKKEAAATSAALAEGGGTEETRGNLRLEEALLAAKRAAPQGRELLAAFLREFSGHPRAAEAHVALAELAFHATPSGLDEARQHLAQAAKMKPSPAAAERADYLRIWLESATPEAKEETVIALAQEFLRRHDRSSLQGEVRLKLAEVHYARQDFARAQTQFEILAQNDPDPKRAERALFFAAKSAMQMMGADSLGRALSLFGEVVKRDGELKWAARNEQAMIERRLEKPQDALTLYDEVLRGDAGAPEKREALCAKGDIFYELGAGDPQNYERAIEFYEALANDADAPAHWRNQAAFKKGICLEKLDRRDEALATFYGIIEEDAEPDRPREFFWYYKAGFNAARLLEEAQNWQPAAAVYEKLAFAGGARSEEAKGRLEQLRLEHFLWDR